MNGATLLTKARKRAGLTQAELARRAGTSQPVISAYEHGRRDPSIETLRRLVRAAGAELDPGGAGQTRLWWDRNPIDLFFSYDPFHDAARDAARRVPFAESTIPVLSVDHLVVCKAVFDRPKDWVDVEAMLAAGAAIDVAEVL